MSQVETLAEQVRTRFASNIQSCTVAYEEVNVELLPEQLLMVAQALRDESPFQFRQLIDISGVDYLHYGIGEWKTKAASTGYSRGVQREATQTSDWHGNRFVVVYHLLSHVNNQRIRLRVLVPNAHQVLPSTTSIWPVADWYEREVFDLFGILFEGHPDLRRILTDYGFIGHPFRKDFPLSGHVEVRYDATVGRVIYEPVEIEPRVLVPKVIRKTSEPIAAEASHDGNS